MQTALHIILLLLGFSGLLLSVYMTYIFVRVMRGDDVKCVDDACPAVMKTPYAQSLGFPNSYLAIPFYAALVVFPLLRLSRKGEQLFVPVAFASGLSALMSVYLVYMLLVRLKRP